ncbi:hypothetical protein AYI68_g4026 [Smittium mucronatum]|uniref:Uncharacterized protein n=1 Tax=Smittium mucronatum TaxID=133383 RepID=A0A1R0GY82_9FUNG|nr:hypothetical protein AYI68_g4026 [Smittium mucronatum]
MQKKYEKKKKKYRKDNYPNYNKLLCRNTDWAPTGKWFNLPTKRPPWHCFKLCLICAKRSVPPVSRWSSSGIAVLQIATRCHH